MIENLSIQTLKLKLDIVEVVGHYLELKRSGASYKAMCPFHDDTNPSMHVSPQKQIYHCFVCGAGGDAIKFVMEYEKLSYPEAIERLASMYNFSLTYTKEDHTHSTQKKVLDILNTQYKKNLTQNEVAKSYLKDRGIFESSIEKFEIGYAPHSNVTLEILRSNGVTMNEAKEVGVADIGENGRAYARFIDRITFPIFAQNGKLVGFGGRTITNHPAKYVNSPQTKLFNKSALLYGYDKAKQTIMKKGSIIVTEGYLDVIMLHQSGFTNAVATLGTALTNEHIPLLSRGDVRVILSYDGDTAGISAALKAAKLLSSRGINGGVVIFNDGADPADMVADGKSDELLKLYDHPQFFVEFCLEQIVKSYDIKNPYEKQKAMQEGLEYLKTLSKIVANEYQGVLASLLHIQESMLPLQKQTKRVHNNAKKEFEDYQELSIIKTLLENPTQIDTVLDSVDFSMFRVHQEQFLLLVNNQHDSAPIRQILMRDDIKLLDEDELIQSLINITEIFYQNELQKVKSDASMDFKTKSFKIYKIQDIIYRLKRGELVPYESFGTI